MLLLHEAFKENKTSGWLQTATPQGTKSSAKEISTQYRKIRWIQMISAMTGLNFKHIFTQKNEFLPVQNSPSVKEI